MKRGLFVIATIFSILFLPPTISAHAGDEFTITITDEGYSPVNLKIRQNDTLIFINNASAPRWPASNIHPTHDIYAEFDPKKPVPVGEKWSFKFLKAGIWQWHDHLLPELVGTITVEEDTDAQAITSDEEKLPEPTFREKMKLRVMKVYFKLFPNELEKQLATISFVKDHKDTKLVRYWVTLVGPQKIIERLLIETNNGVSKDCHQPAHEIGRVAYDIYGDQVFRLASAECHSGTYHGATEAYFKKNGTANLAENLKVVCDTELSENNFFNHQCLHGIGHGITAWTNYDIPTSLKHCDLLPQGRESCYSGVFMENVVGSLAPVGGHSTKYVSDDPHFPCNFVEEKYRGTCYYFQTSRMMHLFAGDFEKITQECHNAPEMYQYLCFESMGRDIDSVNKDNPAKAIATCDLVPEGKYRINCLIGAVQDTFWDPIGQDRALTFCQLLREPTEKRSCYDTIFLRASEVLPTKEQLMAFCGKSGEYELLCRQQAKL